MALETPFYVTFEFSNQADFFSVAATKQLAIVHADCRIGSETEAGQASSGKLYEFGSIRREVEIAFWRFGREPESPYPDGQDVDDWWELTYLWAKYRFRRIGACNGRDFVNYPARFPLPMSVEKDFDMKTTLKSNKTEKEITGLFRERTPYGTQ